MKREIAAFGLCAAILVLPVTAKAHEGHFHDERELAAHMEQHIMELGSLFEQNPIEIPKIRAKSWELSLHSAEHERRWPSPGTASLPCLAAWTARVSESSREGDFDNAPQPVSHSGSF